MTLSWLSYFGKAILILWSVLGIRGDEYGRQVPGVNPAVYEQKDKLPEFHDPNSNAAPGVNPNQYQRQNQRRAHENEPHLHLENQDDERDHIKEHMNFTDTKNMSPEELKFYYFKMVDFDDDGHLDGREMIATMIHSHGHQTETTDVMDDTRLAEILDKALGDMDFNDDGYVAYPEYKKFLAEVEMNRPNEAANDS